MDVVLTSAVLLLEQNEIAQMPFFAEPISCNSMVLRCGSIHGLYLGQKVLQGTVWHAGISIASTACTACWRRQHAHFKNF